MNTFRLSGLALFMLACPPIFGDIAINEIMYHDMDSDLEYIELHNSGAVAVDLSAWILQDNQDSNRYILPNGTSIPPQGYLVIADDRDQFQQNYGALPDLSDLSFNLSNSEDAVRLFNAKGELVESVVYGDRLPWPEAADGNGSSLERRNARFPSGQPSSWGASAGPGTPGKINTIHTSQITPVIVAVKHTPSVPQPNQAVTVTAIIIDPVGAGQTATLRYGHNRGTQYQSAPMLDDGQHGDGEANDGVYGAVLQGSSAGTILRFYVEANYSGASAVAMPPQGGDQPYLAVFENELPNERVPVFRIVMRPEVRDQFLARYQTDDYFPASFYDGDEAYYQIDIRHRGRSRSQNGRFKIRFSDNQLFQGEMRRLNFNGTDAATILREYLSFQLYQDAGLPNLETQLVRFHINGESTRGTPYRVCIENPDSQFLKRRHFFDDDNGNLYKTTLDGTPNNKATWRYVGDDPDLYRDCYIKQTNEDEDDFSDIIEFCKTLTESNPADPDYAERVRSVLNVEEFIRWMAVSAIVAHWDSPYTDHGHNYVMLHDRDASQFNVLAWDLNGTFSHSSNPNDLNYRKHYTHIRSTKFPAINKILNHPEFGAMYFRDIDLLLRTLFTADAMNNRIDKARDAIRASNSSVSFLRTFVSNRRIDLANWINNEKGLDFITKPVYQAAVNSRYKYQAVAVDYRTSKPVAYAKILGPDWLSLNPETGELSGRPPQAGRFNIVVEAQSQDGAIVNQDFSLQVAELRPRLIVNFNEGSGAANDLSGFNNHAALKGRARYSEGRLGSAAELAASGAYFEIPHDDSLNLTGSITVEAWIKPNRIANGNPVILAKGNADAFNYNLMLGYGPWNWDAMEPCFMPHRFNISNRVYYGRKEIEARLRSQEWTHIAGTYDSALELVRVYSNNHPIVHSSSRPRMAENSQPIRIGMSDGSGFQGLVDDVKILPFAKNAFAAGLCLSQVDVSGIASAQDRIALSLSPLRPSAIDASQYCIHFTQSNRWLALPQGALAPGKTIVWWLDDLGLKAPLPREESAALYPIESFGKPVKEFVLDQVSWGATGPGENDPGVQAAVWLPNRSIQLLNNDAATIALRQFADNDDMHLDWEAKPQALAGPQVSLMIENGSAAANSRNVQLQIDAQTPSASWRIRISNTPDLSGEWRPYSTALNWELTPSAGVKTVYLQAADAQGRRSKVVSASIKLQDGTGVNEWMRHE